MVDGSARIVEGRLTLAPALNDVLWGESVRCEGAGWLTRQDLVPRRIVQRLFASVVEAGPRSNLRRREGSLFAL